MKRTRKNTYVERELKRRKAEKRRRIRDSICNFIASVVLVVSFESFMFALLLM